MPDKDHYTIATILKLVQIQVHLLYISFVVLIDSNNKFECPILSTSVYIS